MPKILRDASNRLRNMFDRIMIGVERKAEESAEELAHKFFLEIQERQPDGSRNLDPMAVIAERDPRPSIRQGLVPIAEGWMGGPEVYQHGLTTEIVLRSESEHVQFFTMMTGRPYLGTQGTGEGQTAFNARTLAFWWQGGPHYPVSVRAHGFNVQRDFIRDAWREAIPLIRRGMIKLVIDAATEERDKL